MARSINTLRGAFGAFFCFFLIPGCWEIPTAPSSRGWGVDACLTAHVDSRARAAYLPQLRAAGITIVRERGANPAMAELHAAGFRVDSFLELGWLPVEQRGDALPEDLMAVFSAAKAMQRLHGRYVDAWEMAGEPDVGFCRDLPDRVVAFQKAVYLGIRAGAEEGEIGKQKNSEIVKSRKRESEDRCPLVLMGALALPPGPWLDRAARNGLLDYTDAYNFHFYGFANDLAGVIRAHRAFAAKWVGLSNRSLVERCTGDDGSESWIHVSNPLSAISPHVSSFPFWITECGINAVEPGDFLNPQRRQLQADFTLATARQALAARNVAVFMPFILVHSGDPHALTLAPDRPLPAWNAYADFARRHSFPSRVLAMPPRDPNPVVVQWLPDNRTTIPHKVSGTYRFLDGQPIRGLLRIYNFSNESVRGRLEAGALHDVRLDSRELHPVPPKAGEYGGPSAFQSSVLAIPALGRIDVPVAFAPATRGYFREYSEVSFFDERGRQSSAYFGLEPIPCESDLVAVPIKLQPANRGRIGHPELDGTTVTSQSGAWTGINGLVVQTDGSRQEVETQNPELKTRDGGAPPSIRIVARSDGVNDPLRPTMAIARVRGLPSRGFFHLQLDRPMDSNLGVRVDLIDRKGQRFTIWENFGASYFEPRDDVWLNLDDFHVYFWGQCDEHTVFHPQDVDEIRLRFYFARADDRRVMQLSLWQKGGKPD